MLKAAMLRGGKDPTCALQLVNVAQPLHPRGVDQRFLRYLPLFFVNGKLHIAVDGIGNQRRSLIFAIDELRHSLLLHFENQLSGPLVPGFCHSALMIGHRGDFLLDLVTVRVNLLTADFRFDYCILNFADLEFFQ